MDAADKAPKYGIDGGGVEDGGEEDEDALDHVRGDLICVVMG